MHLFVSCDTVAFRHRVLGKSWLWLFLLGPAPFAFCFVSLLDGEAHIWLGDLRFALCGLGLLFLLCFDLPTYMTTGVHVDVILTCFFSCKDRASERYRPHQRKKKLILWTGDAQQTLGGLARAAPNATATACQTTWPSKQ